MTMTKEKRETAIGGIVQYSHDHPYLRTEPVQQTPEEHEAVLKRIAEAGEWWKDLNLPRMKK